MLEWINSYLVDFMQNGGICSPVNPAYSRFLMPLQQTISEIIVAKGEIAHDEQFLLLLQCFQLYSIIIFSFKEIVFYIHLDVFKVICCRLVVCGKGFKHIKNICCRRIWKSLQMISYWIQLKTLWQNSKLLNMSNFSFCHNVFRCRLLQRRQHLSVCVKGIRRTLFVLNRTSLVS